MIATIYSEQLLQAVTRTRALGYPAPAAAPENVLSLDLEQVFRAVDSLAELRCMLAWRFAAPGRCDVALECARLALAARPRFERAMQCKVLLTLGSVDYEGVTILSVALDDVAEIRRRACYHVWWTLDAGLVVDLTLMAHLALLKSTIPPELLPLVGAPDDTPPIRWRPHLVGDAVMHALTTAQCAPDAASPGAPDRPAGVAGSVRR